MIFNSGFFLPGTFLHASGLNNWGANGDGTTIKRDVLTESVFNKGVKAVSCFEHTLLIDESGSLWSFGLNDYGQLGRSDEMTLVGGVNCGLIPAKVGLLTWKMVSAGSRFSLGIDLNDDLYAWGHNSEYQLGDGTNVSKSTPTKIGSSKWKMISAGLSFSLAIDSNDDLYAWGSNGLYQLGDGTNVDKSTPVKIGAAKWKYISAGTSHSLGIDSNDDLYAWGNNGLYQLGNGGTSSLSAPTKIGAAKWLVVEASNEFSHGITTDNLLFGWGRDTEGQLGDYQARSTPYQVSELTFKAISGGAVHSVALGLDNKLYGAGLNANGELGLGSSVNQVNEFTQIGSSLWEVIAAGWSYSIFSK